MNTDLIVVLDRSGSMESLRDDIIGGYNNILEVQKKEPGECRITLVQFDDRYEVVTEGTPLAQVKPLDHETYVPRGSTALLDAIARTINDQGQRFERMAPADRPEKVIMAILTDGLENASRSFSRSQVHALITRQQQEWGWTIYFIGANQDAIAEAGKLGIDPSAALDMGNNRASVKGAVAVINMGFATSRSTGRGYSYTPADRAKSKVP